MEANYLYHESNLQNKIDNNYKSKGVTFSKFKSENYDSYKQQQLLTIGISKIDIKKKIKLISQYYKKVDVLNKLNWITAQSKFRPTILEEFCGFLFKDIPEIKSLGLGFFNKKVYAGISIDNKGQPIIKTKDIDFCIGKEIEVDFGEIKTKVIIPIIAIECKTYLDKTMFSESQFTAQKLKQGSPNVRVYVLSEENQVDPKEIPSKGQTPVDQIYIIREEGRGKIDADAVYEFFTEVRDNIIKATKQNIINLKGKLLPE